VKPPFEYAISAVRALGARITNPLPIARELQKIGEPLYGAQAPTGFSDRSDAWVNSGALMNRLNFALTLAANHLPGVEADAARLVTNDDGVDAIADALLGGELSKETRDVISARIRSDSEARVPTIAGLVLGSPEFQKQ
jgi:uncharacterized protein (DUF1800 family)